MPTENNDNATPLRIRKTDEPRGYKVIEDAATPPETTPLFNTTPKRPGFEWGGLVVPLIITALIGVGGWYAYTTLSAQNARLTAASSDAVEAESTRDTNLRRIADARTRLDDLVRRTPEMLRRAREDAKHAAEAEARPELERLRDETRRTRQKAEETARNLAAEASQQLTRATAKLAELRTRVDETYDKNTEMKIWLKSNNRTLHPTFPIDPRP